MNTIIFKSFLVLFSSSLVAKADTGATQTLDDFKPSKSPVQWMSVNDSVMGGLSKGGPLITKDHKLLYKGEISLDNNGGFSSLRTSGKVWDLTKYDGIELKIKGDGRKYYLTTRSGNSRRIAFWSPVQPAKGEWQTVRVPFDTFYATFFGRKVPGRELNTAKINSIGFMLYDKKAGAFSIEVDSITAYKE